MGTRQKEGLHNSGVLLGPLGMRENTIYVCPCDRLNLIINFLEICASCYRLAFGLNVFFNGCFLSFSGVISCILHSQWRIWFRQATYCQYLHELAEASWVLWWKSYAKQTSLCHWMCCWIWIKLSQTNASLKICRGTNQCLLYKQHPYSSSCKGILSRFLQLLCLIKCPQIGFMFKHNFLVSFH